MSFFNPNFKDKKKEFKEEVNEEVKNENIISVDDILNTPKMEKVNIELIDYPKSAVITNVPRNINLSANELGVVTVKYGNFSDSFKMNM